MKAAFLDSLNFFKKLTVQKIFNFLVLLITYYLSKISKKNYFRGLPFAVSIEPTTSCNLRCPECPSGLRSFTRPTGMLSDANFKLFISQLKHKLAYLTFYFQGEPYLNPSFLKQVKYAHENGIYTMTSTNAHYLDETKAEETVLSGLDRLIISIDGTTQETYESYRVGGDLEKVLKGTRNIIAAKNKFKSSKPYIIFQFLVVKPNQHQIPEVFKLAKDLGVDKVVLKTAQIYDYQNGSDLIPDIEKYARYKKNQDGSFEIKNSLSPSCWKMWHSAVITWDGQVVPCCFDKDASHKLGTISAQTSFKNIWYGDTYQNFRSKILHSRSEIDICKNCTEGTKVFF